MRKGFTLIEMVVVIAIITVLAGIITPNALKVIDNANRSATVADWQAIKTSTIAFENDTGVFPNDNCHGALSANTNCVGGSYAGWAGPYIEKWPARNRWGGIYVLRVGDYITWSDADSNINSNPSIPDSAFITLDDIPLSIRILMEESIDGVSIAGVGCGNGNTVGHLCGEFRWGTAETGNSYLLVATDELLRQN